MAQLLPEWWLSRAGISIFEAARQCIAALLQPEELQPGKKPKTSEKRKPGSVGKSTLPGVEVAGFEPAAFWSRIPGLPLNGLTLPFHA